MPKKKTSPKAAKKPAKKATQPAAKKKAAKKAAKKAPASAKPAKKAAPKKAAKKAPVKKPEKAPTKKAPAKKTPPKKKPKKAVAPSKSKSKPSSSPKKSNKSSSATKSKPTPKKRSSKPPQRSGPRFPIKGHAHPSPFGASGPEKKPKSKPRKLTAVFLEKQKQKLIDLRDHILDQMQGVAQDSLRSNGDSGGGSAFGMHQADAGSDAYEKDFALSLLSQEQDALYEIEEAIKRIEAATYGVCEMSGENIPKARLEAIPFARFTVECQQQVEREQRGRSRWESSPQFMKSTDNFFDESDDSDDDTGPKLKDS